MTCAFVSCAEASSCGLAGGCVASRFAAAAGGPELKKRARKLAGTKPARTNRDPRFIKRKRKVRL